MPYADKTAKAAYDKARYAANTESASNNARAWYRANRERVIKRQAAWYLANKHKIKPNKAKRAENERRRKSKSVIVGCKLAIQAIYRRSQELRQWFAVEVDHVIPLCAGGTHSADNLQIIYGIENRRKRHRASFKPTIVFV